MTDIEGKVHFYEQIQSVIGKVPARDMKIVMGDLNTKVGTDNTNRDLIMGRHGTGEQNEHGELFAEFCTSNDLVIGGTLFPHKTIHKTTWTSPDGKTENQIDHITIGRKWSLRARRQGEAWRGRSIGPPPGCGRTQDQAQGLQRLGSTTITQIQCTVPERETEIRGIQN